MIWEFPLIFSPWSIRNLVVDDKSHPQNDKEMQRIQREKWEMSILCQHMIQLLNLLTYEENLNFNFFVEIPVIISNICHKECKITGSFIIL